MSRRAERRLGRSAAPTCACCTAVVRRDVIDRRCAWGVTTVVVTFALSFAAFGSSASGAAATPCPVTTLEKAARMAGGATFSRADCVGGWALAAGQPGRAGIAVLFRADHGHWVAIHGLAEEQSREEGPLENAVVASGIAPSAIAHLAAPFDLSIREEASAGGLVERLATRVGSAGYQASPVLQIGGRTWLVLEGGDASPAANPATGASPYPNASVWVYRWTHDGWREQGEVHGYVGPVGGCCGILPESLTGSRDPDFAMEGGGAADTLWFAVVSDTGGSWHLVPFDYGYADTTVVNAYPGRRGVFTEVDASSAAGGPSTSLYETYRNGEFRPAQPPGKAAPCSRAELQWAAGDAQLEVFEFSRFACADGWAMAIGTGAGYSGQVVGLFNSYRTKWRAIEVDNGDSLGSFPAIYDIPTSLLLKLAAGFGPSVRPALATVPLIAQTATAGYSYLNGVVTLDGVDWYVTETPTGSEGAQSANAQIYRWSGSAWVEQGRVERLPRSLNYFQALTGGWFEPEAVPGSDVPVFAMEGTRSLSGETSLSTAVITDAGGFWHVGTAASR
jgi:hypothetical protein